MIAIIRVTLNRGEFASGKDLHNVVASLFHHRVSLRQERRARGVQGYVADMGSASVYTCVPRPGSQALFLWVNAREFEIIIETFHHGHLFRSSETVVSALRRRLRELNMKAGMDVSLDAPGDAQTYLKGKPSALLSCLWDEIKDNIVALIIGVILVIIVSKWLTQYYDECIGGIISLILFSIWKVYLVWDERGNILYTGGFMIKRIVDVAAHKADATAMELAFEQLKQIFPVVEEKRELKTENAPSMLADIVATSSNGRLILFEIKGGSPERMLGYSVYPSVVALKNDVLGVSPNTPPIVTVMTSGPVNELVMNLLTQAGIPVAILASDAAATKAHLVSAFRQCKIDLPEFGSEARKQTEALRNTVGAKTKVYAPNVGEKGIVLSLGSGASISTQLEHLLEIEGYLMRQTSSLEGLQEIVRHDKPSGVIIDQDEFGDRAWSICVALKDDSATRKSALILLSSVDDENLRIKGFESGADDFVAKPYSPREMIARIKAISRRISSGDTKKIRVKDIEIDLEEHRVTKAGKPIDLTFIQFKLLSLLAARRNNVFSRKEILEKVWGKKVYVTNWAVDVNIRRLRKKLGEYKYSSQYIEEIPGTGYRLL